MTGARAKHEARRNHSADVRRQPVKDVLNLRASDVKCLHSCNSLIRFSPSFQQRKNSKSTTPEICQTDCNSLPRKLKSSVKILLHKFQSYFMNLGRPGLSRKLSSSFLFFSSLFAGWYENDFCWYRPLWSYIMLWVSPGTVVVNLEAAYECQR